MSDDFFREQLAILKLRIKATNPLIQVLMGPRQVGKTTLVKKLYDDFVGPKLFLSADDPQLSGHQNLDERWLNFIVEAKLQPALLIIDEIHKFPKWDAITKARWDQCRREHAKIKVILLGSAPLLIQKGLSESLAGRFEIIPIPHWSLDEIRKIKPISLNEFIFFGSYPGSMEFMHDENRWKSYIKNSLIETTISRDIMLLTRIDKPALLRQLFYLSCEYSGQVLSYQKMTGQLQDAGNTTTLAHYLDLLSAVGFVKGLKKFTGSQVHTRNSSPKLQVYNTALLSGLSEYDFKSAHLDSARWGRWVESAVGAYLLKLCFEADLQLEYWKDRNYEVDFILRKNKKVVAIEVKSGRKKESISGLVEIKKQHSIHKSHTVGDHNGIPLENFFNLKIEDLF